VAWLHLQPGRSESQSLKSEQVPSALSMAQSGTGRKLVKSVKGSVEARPNRKARRSKPE